MAAKRKSERLFVGILVLLAGILLGAGIIHMAVTNNAESGNSGVQLDKNAVSFSGNADAVENEQVSIRFPGYPEISVRSEEMEIPIVLTNPEGNLCYFQFRVTIEETGQELLNSGWVEPGSAIRGIGLDEALGSGDYQLLIQIATGSLNDRSAMNGGTVRTGLHVE